MMYIYIGCSTSTIKEGMNYSCVVYQLQLCGLWNVHGRKVINSCNQGVMSSADLSWSVIA
jgi:hypothetical protein